MRSLGFFVLGMVLLSPAVFGQTASTDSQSLQALLAEVRQLRQDLQTSFVAAQRAQILIYRAQAQETVVTRTVRQLDDARAKLAATQSDRKNLGDQIKRMEEGVSTIENPVERKEIEAALLRLKTKLEMLGNEEQQSQSREIELQDQLRMEQAKLADLHDLLDRLQKALENFRLELRTNPH
jgi:predicted  nucleic acid-binding Zn-ribbon protein